MIPILLLIAIAIFKFVLGNPANFVDGDNTKDPLPGNFMGQMYKGGFMVPLLITSFFTVIVFVVERFILCVRLVELAMLILLSVASKDFWSDMSGAMAACDKQKGSVANVVRAGLGKYAEMEKITGMEKDKK